MNTNKTMDARISAFADGTLDGGQHEQLLLALQQPEARLTWETYHCIGDVLRSPETAVDFSTGFSSRMADLLAAEPAHLGATAVAEPINDGSAAGPWQAAAMLRRFGMRGAAVAAAIVLALVAMPKLGDPHQARNGLPGMVASAGGTGVASSDAAGTLLRNPQIDEYLLAHQRYSPSVYSTAQLARSATFTSDK